MSEADLKSYNLQMQQVEAALTSDPGNQELLTLKTDLDQVIELTKQLIEQQSSVAQPQASSASVSKEAATSSGSIDSESSKKKVARPHDHIKPIKHWQVGEQCQAIWSKDGQ